MALSNGCNHLTIITGDIDRLVDFYRRIFDAEVRFDRKEDGIRHALIDLGGNFCLHPFELEPGNPNAETSRTMFDRGHIDHFAIDFSDEENFEEVRRRLVADGASDGSVRDFGMARVMTFEDPDGMECELARWQGRQVLSLAESRVEEFQAS